MNKQTKLILQGIELRERYPDQKRDIESKMTQLIDSMDMTQLLDLATELQTRGIVNFGYPQKIKTEVPPPSPTRTLFGLGWLIFKGKK